MKRDIEHIKRQVQTDVELLQEFKLMDYSLLLAIEQVKRTRKVDDSIRITPSSSTRQIVSDYAPTFTDRHRFKSSCGNFVYHIAMIDYLQTFNLEKWTESKFKIWILRRNDKLISAIEPEFYAERFLRFMSTEVFIDTNLFNPAIEYAKLRD